MLADQDEESRDKELDSTVLGGGGDDKSGIVSSLLNKALDLQPKNLSGVMNAPTTFNMPQTSFGKKEEEQT